MAAGKGWGRRPMKVPRDRFEKNWQLAVGPDKTFETLSFYCLRNKQECTYPKCDENVPDGQMTCTFCEWR
jgi:hypothetical protein